MKAVSLGSQPGVGFVASDEPAGGPSGSRAPVGRLKGLSVKATLRLAFAAVLIGTLDEMTEELHWRRQEYGISYWSIEADCWEALGPVVSKLSGT